MVAYHSVLVFDVLGVSEQGDGMRRRRPSRRTTPSSRCATCYETYHEHQRPQRAGELSTTPSSALDTAHEPVRQRLPAARAAVSRSENLFWAICRRIRKLTKQLEYVPGGAGGARCRCSADTYFCNFSLFQSMPDSWAIKQLFPVMPIHRLDEQPDPARPCWATSPATPTARSTSSSTAATSSARCRCTRSTDEPYYLGAFLIGAYQEILGDLHNLFGDTNAVHVSTDERGEVVVDAIIKGDTVREVLDYVQFDADQLVQRLRDSLERAVREGRIGDGQAGRFLQFYEEGLGGYTYLEEPG